jgi:hypothetical protein
MKLRHEEWIARIPHTNGNDCDTHSAVGIVRRCAGGWAADARIGSSYIDLQTSRPAAQRALAAALRQLANEVEREET